MSGIIDRRKNPLNAVELPFGYSCAFTGAFFAGIAMKGCGVVTHCSPGCNFALYVSGTGASAKFSRQVPQVSTMISEKDVIFGAEELLYNTLVNFAQVRPSDFQLLIAGCSPGVTGDDIKEAGERAYRKTKIPVVAVNAGGFAGNTVDGYNRALCAMAEHPALEEKAVKKNSVNLIGVIPVHDLFWKGNIDETARILGRAGVEVNSVFVGDGARFDDIKNLPSAELNVVVSDSVGFDAVTVLRERFGTPFTVCGEGYPAGTSAVSGFLTKVCDKLGISEKTVRSVIDDEEKKFYSSISDYEGAVNDIISRHRYFLFSDSYYALGLFAFLTGELGMIPSAVAVSSSTPSTLETLEILCERFNVSPFLAIDPDNADLEKIAEETNPTIMIGRGEDFHLTRRYNIPLVGISPTHLHRINSCAIPMIGYKGGLAVIDEIFRETVRAG